MPIGRVGLIRSSLGLFAMALAASCGNDSSGPSSSEPGGGGAADSAPGNAGSASAGKRSGESGANEASLGGGGTGSDPWEGYSGNLSGGSGPPTYDCDPTAISQLPSSVVNLDGVFKNSAIASDDAGNTYVASATPSSDSFVRSEPLAPPGGLVLHKIDAAGHFVWSKRFGSDEPDQQDRLASLFLSTSGEIVVAADLSVVGATAADPSDWGAHRLAIFRFDADGAELSRITHEAPFDAGVLRVFPVAGQLYLWGSAWSPFTLDDVEVHGSQLAPTFVAKLDADGYPLAVQSLAGMLRDVVMSPAGESFALVAEQGHPGKLVAISPELEPSWNFIVSSSSRLALDDQVLLVAGMLEDSYLAERTLVVDRFDIAAGALLVRSEVANGHDLVVQALAALPDHSFVIAGVGTDGMRVGATLLRSANPEGPLMIHMSPTNEPLWATLLCTNGHDYSYSGVLQLSNSGSSPRALLSDTSEVELGSLSVEQANYPSNLLLDFAPPSPSDQGSGGQAPD